MVRTARQNAKETALTSLPPAVAAWQAGTLAFVEAGWRSVLERNPRDLSALRALSDITHQAGRHEEAAQLLRRFAKTPPELHNLGISLDAIGQHAEAEAAYRKAIRRDPGFVSAYLDLGNLLHRRSRFQEAEAQFRRALVLRDGSAWAWIGLGNALHYQGRLSDALDAFRKAIAHEPSNAIAHCNLGTLLFALDRNGDALAELQTSLRLNPRSAVTHGNLGGLLARSGCPITAESSCRNAISLAPGEYSWFTNLGVALFSQGRFAEAEAAYRKALQLRSDYPLGHGNLLFLLNYRTDISPEAIFAEYQEWDRLYAKPLARGWQRFSLDRTPGRRLRVGYVSPDFRQHAAAMFAEPLLAAHDHSAVELYLYSDVAGADAATTRFRALCDHWRDTVGLSDAQLAELIRSDQIDILVDLAGHSASNRLLAFARRPAPVQVAYLLGHGYTTGLSAIDAFLADDDLAPNGVDALFSERLIRLPRIPLTFVPPDDMPPVALHPAQSVAHLTFGHFGRPERLNQMVIAAWARLLHAVPGSRLVLNNRPFQEPAFRQLFLSRFAQHGIDAARIDLIHTAPGRETWGSYDRIDIALDPFPHNAGTTTIEALWQGVPVVTLKGRPTVGRFGASILHAVGLDDWVTEDIDSYVARAVAAGSDLPTLATLRADLRQRVARSPICDAPGLAHLIECTYRMLWDEWREGDGNRLRRLYAEGALLAARDLARHMIRRDDTCVDANHVLGLLAYRDGRLGGADTHLRRAIARDPGIAELHANHAAILRKLGRLEEAEAAARAALRLEPEHVGALNNLGNILRDAGRYDESVTHLRSAVRLAPHFADAWINLAWVLALAGHARQAEDAARQAIACDAGNADGHNNLGLALMRQGRLAEAEAALRQALALRPDNSLPHSNILFCLNYRPNASAHDIFAEYRNWDRCHAQPLMPPQPGFELDASPERRLRVGYVSPDFRQHAVALFAEPLLAAHDRSVVEIHCYAEVPAPDAVTARLRDLADHWHGTVGLSDAELAEQIRRDRIDVLVDLAGHTAGNRLLVFARKPAPIQVEWLVGHGYTSGLSAMDVFLADAELAPSGADDLFSERLIRLSRIPLAYAPPADMPEVAPLPAAAAGHLTFGYFGRTVRLNDGVLEAWARILHTIPNARLMLNSAPFAEAAGRDQMSGRFAQLGIAADRLDLVHTTPQQRTWAAYAQIDIALDPFPHNAGTTTIEALWQGVPVLSLAGRSSVGRFGAAILHAIGLDDWVVHDVDAYVDRAVAAAADIDGLARLRARLRPRFAASPLGDAVGLAREIEATYRDLWRQWCRGAAPDPRRLYAAGDTDSAIRAAELALSSDPHDIAALHVLGLSRFHRGDTAAALALLRQAIEPAADADVLSDLGVVLRSAGRLDEAEAAYRRALQLAPSHVQALGNLGNVLLDLHRADEARLVLSEALRHAPEQPWLLHSIALSQMACADQNSAEAALRQALAIDPGNAEAHDALGALLSQSGRPIEAEAHYRAALSRTGHRHRALSNLSVVLQTQGRHAEAEQCCREALAEQPGYAAAHNNLLFSLNYRQDLTAEAIFAEYREWDQRHAAPLAVARPCYPLTPARRLRVGYVSADFRQHAVAYFAAPLLEAHDRERIELFCYAAVVKPDAITERFCSAAEHWRDIATLDDTAAAELMRRDEIDVLVDLTGHTAGSRLLVFARKPAPVQVTYLLGHGYTSGLSAMDGFLADAVLAPPDADALFSERLVRLPRIPLAYAAPAGMPEVAQPPALANGFVSFGYFGRTERLNEAVIAIWARILRELPGARLVLNSAPFREPAFRDLIAKRFATHNIERERLRMLATDPLSATWSAYAGVDVALDPFPHNAGTTTVEALWQGVPVVSLAGRPSVGRFGAMILHAVGMDDWVSSNADEYVARAIAAANDLNGLANTRGALRQRVAESPLCDAAGLARHVEDAYRALCAAC